MKLLEQPSAPPRHNHSRDTEDGAVPQGAAVTRTVNNPNVIGEKPTRRAIEANLDFHPQPSDCRGWKTQQSNVPKLGGRSVLTVRKAEY